MSTPIINKICWLIKKKNNSLKIAGFLRDHQDGVFIIGGETGSYYSGHGENWKKKWDECLQQDYAPVNLAIEKGLIKKDWKPPQISKKDQEIVDKINNCLL